MPMMILLAAASLAAAPADQVLGRWRTPGRNGLVEITRCGATICGRLIGSDGLTKQPDMRDINNRDAALRGRKLLGLSLLAGDFVAKGAEWSGGTVYNAEDGGTYKATVTAIDPDHLRLKGCIVWPLCKSQTWTRAR